MNNDTIEWKDIPGYEGYYQVSDTGLIKRIAEKPPNRRNKILSPGLKENGYLFLILHKDGKERAMYVHRLVTMAFLGDPGSMDVNHKNGVRTDNRLDNLEYCTRTENIRHAIDVLGNSFSYGDKRLGENNGRAKIDDTRVQEIRQMLADGINCSEIARRFSMSRYIVNRIKHRQSWNHVK